MTWNQSERFCNDYWITYISQFLSLNQKQTCVWGWGADDEAKKADIRVDGYKNFDPRTVSLSEQNFIFPRPNIIHSVGQNKFCQNLSYPARQSFDLWGSNHQFGFCCRYIHYATFHTKSYDEGVGEIKIFDYDISILQYMII